jgi:hypothetical protein
MKAVIKEPDSYYKDGITMGYNKLMKYYDLSQQTPIYRAAVVLHPESKLSYFDDKWQGWPNWVKFVEKDVKALYQEYVNEAESEEEDSEPATRLRTNKNQKRSDDESEDEYQDFRRVHEKFRDKRKRRKLLDEFDRYIDDGIPKDPVPDPLSWWREHATIYPILAKMAFDLFSIPAMSSECERVFSQAKKLITDERNRLSPATIEADECQKNWLSQGLVQ